MKLKPIEHASDKKYLFKCFEMTSAWFVYIFSLSQGKVNKINPFVYILLYLLST